MSGRPALIRQRDLKQAIMAAQKPGAPKVELQLGGFGGHSTSRTRQRDRGPLANAPLSPQSPHLALYLLVPKDSGTIRNGNLRPTNRAKETNKL
jgi:hypothetical protein